METRVIVAGGGIVGRTLAIALATQSHLKVTLLTGSGNAPDERASAISAAGRKLFSRLGVWPQVASASQPIDEMMITDSAPDDVVRPDVLTFSGGHGAEAFAHMVPNRALLAALVERCDALGIRARAEAAVFYDETESGVTVRLAGGDTLSGDVLVAADGRQSRLRSIAGIETVDKSYDQWGITGTITHAAPHHGRAIQHFFQAGPLAMLPLPGNASSIVWTERPGFAKSLGEMDPMIASLEVERVFGLSLGRLCVEPPLQTYPLTAMIARDFVAGRVALAGDAAHVIHPLAGQGLNLGLRDAAALAESLTLAHRHGEDIRLALPRYARWRRADVVEMALVTDRLNAIFSQRSDLLRAVRSVGLGLIDRREELKTFFIGEASGLSGDVPKLMRGEAV